MAVKLDFLQPGEFSRNLADNTYLYKDLALDLELEYANTIELLSQPTFNDAKAIYDTESVLQSLRNIFGTLPGQKILSPTFGLDLRSFLFNQANNRTGYVLALTISKQLPILEPRIAITGVDVDVFPDDLTYEVNIFFRIPTLETVPSKPLNIKVQFNKNGFTIV